MVSELTEDQKNQLNFWCINEVTSWQDAEFQKKARGILKHLKGVWKNTDTIVERNIVFSRQAIQCYRYLEVWQGNRRAFDIYRAWHRGNFADATTNVVREYLLLAEEAGIKNAEIKLQLFLRYL